MGLYGATLIGVGAIVGGGILALAGTAFAVAGPAAIVAFALNGVIALITAHSFAGMAAAFPQNGGSYTFAKMVLSVRAAFAVGWMVWFSSIAAGVLYALGFAVYGVLILEQLMPMAGQPMPDWFRGRVVGMSLAAAATLFYSWRLIRRAAGGGSVETIGKVIIFIAFIAVGFVVLLVGRADAASAAAAPIALPSTFFHGGMAGLAAAMGFTFIALQGFDLIAAVSGEVREPQRTVPRAMYLSLAIALVVYLPLLVVVIAAGVPAGSDIVSMSAAAPASVVALSARTIMGNAGFWMIALAALLSMLSALQANLFAASRIARAMSRDRTLPAALSKLHATRATPVGGVLGSCVLLIIILAVIPDVAAAGAAASLMFLLTFALVHWMNILARARGAIPTTRKGYILPALGGLLCAGLATFQAIAVPSAGIVTAVWMGLGVVIYATLFARRAEAVDAHDLARHATRAALRGASPLVLVPIANPGNAPALVSVAHAVAPPRVGRVLLLSIIRGAHTDIDGLNQSLVGTQQVLSGALASSFSHSIFPEALCTVADNPWREIIRVATLHQCASLLLGISDTSIDTSRRELENLIGTVSSDVVLLRSSPGWQVASATRVLVPIGGRGGVDTLRSRLLGSLARTGQREVTLLAVLPTTASPLDQMRAERSLKSIGEEECPDTHTISVVRSDAPADALRDAVADTDLAILGLQRVSRGKRVLGSIATRLLKETTTPLLLMSRRG